jgi:Flp pilus assembly protein TadG
MTIRNSIHRFLADEDATATVEFVIVFPVLLMVFISAFETAMILTRQVMLERAVDSTVRYLRLTSGISVTHDQIRQNICDNALLLPNCVETLLLDVRVVNRNTYQLPDSDTLCVDLGGTVTPANSFHPGAQNDLMLLRACALVERILPTSGYGLKLTQDDQGFMHMMVSTIFVNEPD